MLWDEVDVEAALSNEEIARRMAKALAIPPQELAVVEQLDAKVQPEVLIQPTRRKGQFPLRLGIYFVGKRTPPDRAPARAAIARALGSRILVSDAGVNPYTRTAIDPKGEQTGVRLDPLVLDEKDELRLDDRLVLKSSAGDEVGLDPARSLVVGRSRDGGLAVPDQALARRHFELRFAGGSWHVEDLKSASGTYVNGKLARGPTQIVRGDEIRAGQTVFTLC